MPLALVLFVLANTAFEIGTVFYNAMLPGLVAPERIGRLSGWGWGLGYAGGLACLVVVLVVFVQADPPPFGLDKSQAEHVRAAAPLVALWLAIFAVPIFVFAPDAPATGVGLVTATRQGLSTLIGTIRHIRSFRGIGAFPFRAAPLHRRAQHAIRLRRHLRGRNVRHADRGNHPIRHRAQRCRRARCRGVRVDRRLDRRQAHSADRARRYHGDRRAAAPCARQDSGSGLWP